MSARKQWGTPEKIIMMESIKKSIHRSIQKINPIDYKNILKGENIYIHLSYQGEIINSEYTKVALFMGAIVYKKAFQKITAVVTNEISNKTVRKLAAMNKPILSVLWLQACFQQKRKVPYSDFLFEEEKNQNLFEEEESEEYNETFALFLSQFEIHARPVIKQLDEQFANSNTLRFLEKKQKISEHNKQYVIETHEIDLGAAKRKSETVSQRIHRKKNKKKVDFKSEGLDKKLENKQTQELEEIMSYSEAQNNIGNLEKDSIEDNEDSARFIYKKYLKDFKEYENEYDHKKPVIPQKIENQEETPFFSITETNQEILHSNNQNQDFLNTPNKASQPKDMFTKTCSVKKHKPYYCIFSHVNNPNIRDKIDQINEQRRVSGLSLVGFDPNITSKSIVLVSASSKVDTLRAKLENPKMIINNKLMGLLEKNPLIDLSDELLKKYEIKFRLNMELIRDKRFMLFDSVIGVQFLERVINTFGGHVIKVGDFLFKQIHVDLVISNRKTFIKTDKQSYRVYTEGKLIDLLIQNNI